MFKPDGNPVGIIKRGGYGNQSWKSDAFLNFYLPSKDGGRKKIGAIGLKMSQTTHRQLIELLSEDPEARVQDLLAKLQAEFRMAKSDEDSELDL